MWIRENIYCIPCEFARKIVNSKFIRKTDSRFESYFEIDSELNVNSQKKNSKWFGDIDSEFAIKIVKWKWIREIDTKLKVYSRKNSEYTWIREKNAEFELNWRKKKWNQSEFVK